MTQLRGRGWNLWLSIGESVTYAWPTPSDSIAGRFSCAPGIFYTGVSRIDATSETRAFPGVFLLVSRPGDKSVEKWNTCRARSNFIRRPIWFMKISIDFFPSPPNESRCSLHATRINLCPEPIIQRRTSWRHKCVATSDFGADRVA